MAIARLYDFTNITVRDHTKIDAEFNQIINFFTGVTTTEQLYLVFNDGSTPPLTVGQLSNGSSIEFQLNGTTKVNVSGKGALTSTVSTGTAPFSISSTTKCTNLNVGYLDGIDTVNFNSNSALDQFFNGSLQITKLSTGTQSIKFSQDADTFSVKRTSDSSTLFSVEDLESDEARILSFPSTTRVQLEYTPEETDYFDVARLEDLIGTLTPKLTIHANTRGSKAAGDAILVFVVPVGLPIMKLNSLNIRGSGAGRTFKVYHNSDLISTITGVTTTVITNIFYDGRVLAEDDLIKVIFASGTTASIGVTIALNLTC